MKSKDIKFTLDGALGNHRKHGERERERERGRWLNCDLRLSVSLAINMGWKKKRICVKL